MRVHYTLHGYQDGHQLLATSRELPAVTQRHMLLLSDMSGSSMIKGFDTYITGYPLPEIASYAFARTWYAPEMRRPGCVWTHTLLVDFSELDAVSMASVLCSMFRRPNGDWDWYNSPQAVVVDAGDDRGVFPSSLTPNEITRALLDALYGSPSAPVVLAADNAETFEGAVLAVWEQQWPRLRRNFTFCTGALSPRSFGDRMFDLQVAPYSSLRSFTRIIDDHSVVTANKMTLDPAPWLDVVVTDLTYRTGGHLRRFLWRYSGDTAPHRSTMAPLVHLYGDIARVNGGTMPFSTVVEHLAASFPDPKIGRHLKTVLCGDTRQSEIKQATVPEEEVLLALATTRGYAAFDARDLNLAVRARAWGRLNNRRMGEVVRTLLQSPMTPLGESVLEGTLDGLATGDALALVREQPLLLPLLAAANPALAESPDVWRASIDQQRTLLDTLLKSNSGTVAWALVIAAALDAQADGVAEELIERLGFDAVHAVLDWLDKVRSAHVITPDTLPKEWRRVLALHPALLLRWLAAAAPEAVEVNAYVTTLLDPHSPDVHGFRDSWGRAFAQDASAIRDHTLLVETMAFLLALAFDGVGASAPFLFAASFTVVHAAASRGELPFDAWRSLQAHLSTLDGWRDWDQCEKLRRASVWAFIAYRWSPEFFRAALKDGKDERVFRWTIDYCDDIRDGKVFLQMVRACVEDNPNCATGWQKSILFKKRKRRRFE